MGLIQSKVQRQDEPQPHFRFLDLPTEIRIVIYEELLVVGKVFYSPSRHDLFNGQRHRGFHLFRKPELQLLRVCRQIHDEAEPIYLSKNLFVLPMFWPAFQPIRTDSSSFYHHYRPDNTSPHERRHLFSAKGLIYVKNISFSFDQLDLSGTYGRDFDYWQCRKLKYKQRSFEQLSDTERFARVHEPELDLVMGQWQELTQYLQQFKNLIDYLEIDFSNAFCPFGDCRPVSYGLHTWIQYLDPISIDAIGLYEHEQNDFEFEDSDNETVSRQDCEDRFGLRFRSPEDPTRWDKWMMDGEVDDQEFIEHYVRPPLPIIPRDP